MSVQQIQLNEDEQHYVGVHEVVQPDGEDSIPLLGSYELSVVQEKSPEDASDEKRERKRKGYENEILYLPDKRSVFDQNRIWSSEVIGQSDREEN